MRLTNLDIDQAIGGILIHNISDAQGHKAFSKGHRLTAGDVEKLYALGKTQVFVGVPEPGDVGENEAAARVANTVAGEHITLSAVSSGRVNLLANTRGILKVRDEALGRLNSLDGITIATIPGNQVVAPNKMVATVKMIGLAVPETVLQRAESIGRQAGFVIGVRPLGAARVAVILTGSKEARARIEKSFLPAIQGRVEELGADIVSNVYVEHQEYEIALAIEAAKAVSTHCVILAGETSIMDASDVTPMGIVRAGGEIQVYGAPVEPGNLLLLAYVGDLPVLGAPGCIKSRDTNVVDLILPRLLSGERVGKRDIIALANGGLMI